MGLIMRPLGPEVINFFMLNSTEHEISFTHETKMKKKMIFLPVIHSDVVVILLINVKCQQLFAF